jgi:hypothetical protein
MVGLGTLVEKLAADRSDPVLSEGVGYRGADSGLEDLEGLGSKDLVEGVDELAASVPNQRSCASELVAADKEQAASGLSCPGSGRVGRCAGVEGFSGGNVGEDQQVVATEQRAVDGEEITGHRGLGVEEL